MNEGVTHPVCSQFLGAVRIFFTVLLFDFSGYSILLAQRYLTTFGVVAEMKTLHNPYAILAGDFNGDGTTDLLTYSGRNIEIHLQSPDSLEWRSTSQQLNLPITRAAAGKCNKDRYTDLVVLTEEQSELQVYLAKPGGKFYLGWKQMLHQSFDNFIVADVNNDGKNDLLLFGKKEAGITVFLGNGNGTFRQGTVLFPEQSYSIVAVTDLNDDGINDVVAVNWVSNEVSIYSGIGRMKFAEPSILSLENEPTSINAAPLDSDGNVDLIIGYGNDHIVQTYMADGFGSFSLHQTLGLGLSPSEISVGDVNGDGQEDIVVLDTTVHMLTVVLNDGKGTFTERIDFAAGNSSTHVVLFPHSFSNANNAAVLQQSESRIRLLYSSAVTGQSGDQRYGVGLFPVNLIVTDVNRDRLPDILVANSGSRSVSLLLNGNDGSLQGQLAFSVSGEVQHIRYYSLNDSTILILGTHPANDGISAVKINLKNYSSASYTLPTQGKPEILRAKVDSANGFLHIYSLVQETGEDHPVLTEYEQINGTRFIERPVDSLSHYVINAAEISDFDGDGYPDVVFSINNRATKKQEFYAARGNQNEEFEHPKLEFAVSEDASHSPMIWSEDFNVDGKPDLAVYFPDAERSLWISLALADSSLSFSPPGFQFKDKIVITDRDHVKFVDFNGDGIPDIVIENNFNKTIQEYTGKGDGTFFPPARLMSSEGISDFAICRLYNDTTLYLINAEQPKGTVRIIPLNGRQ